MNTHTSRKIGYNSAKDINNILIIDSACDQSIISNNEFIVLSRSRSVFYVNGILTGRMEAEIQLEGIDAMTMVTLKSGNSYILQMNQVLLDLYPSQT